MRRECLDWMIPISEAHLRSILREWVAHYNGGRPHSALGPGVPGPPTRSARASKPESSASMDTGRARVREIRAGRTCTTNTPSRRCRRSRRDKRAAEPNDGKRRSTEVRCRAGRTPLLRSTGAHDHRGLLVAFVNVMKAHGFVRYTSHRRVDGIAGRGAPSLAPDQRVRRGSLLPRSWEPMRTLPRVAGLSAARFAA